MIIVNHSNVTYDYTLPDESVVSGSQDSNIVRTEVLTDAIKRVKSSDKTFLSEGETAKQTVVITNDSGAKLTDVFFKDVMTAGAEYVAGSVTVDGEARPAYDPAAGFELPDIPAGESVTVSYTIVANDPKTNDSVTNRGVFTYTVDDPERGPVTYTEDTNDVRIDLISVKLTVVKSVDKAYAKRGETLHYTSVVTNTGSIKKTNVQFRDIIPAGTAFVAGSVEIDGVSYPSYNPAAGFPLDDLAPGESTTVEFDVTVI